MNVILRNFVYGICLNRKLMFTKEDALNFENISDLTKVNFKKKDFGKTIFQAISIHTLYLYNGLRSQKIPNF